MKSRFECFVSKQNIPSEIRLRFVLPVQLLRFMSHCTAVFIPVPSARSGYHRLGVDQFKKKKKRSGAAGSVPNKSL